MRFDNNTRSKILEPDPLIKEISFIREEHRYLRQVSPSFNPTKIVSQYEIILWLKIPWLVSAKEEKHILNKLGHFEILLPDGRLEWVKVRSVNRSRGETILEGFAGIVYSRG